MFKQVQRRKSKRAYLVRYEMCALTYKYFITIRSNKKKFFFGNVWYVKDIKTILCDGVR